MHWTAHRRRSIRLCVVSPVTFSWNERETSQRRVARGVSRDVSAAGVLIESEVVPPLDCTVRYKLLLRRTSDPKDDWVLDAVGRVRRVSSNGTGVPNLFGVCNRKFVLIGNAGVFADETNTA